MVAVVTVALKAKRLFQCHLSLFLTNINFLQKESAKHNGRQFNTNGLVPYGISHQILCKIEGDGAWLPDATHEEMFKALKHLESAVLEVKCLKMSIILQIVP